MLRKFESCTTVFEVGVGTVKKVSTGKSGGGAAAGEQPWFWGMVSEFDVVAALGRHTGKDGTFTLRQNGGREDQAVLSVVSDGKVVPRIVSSMDWWLDT